MNLEKYSKKELISILASKVEEGITEKMSAYNHITSVIKNWEQENFVVLFMNNQNKVIHKEVLFKGASNACSVDPLVIFKKFFKYPKANTLIIGHNHPSGCLSASTADEEITKRIRNGCYILGITFLDSLIVTETGYISIKGE